MRVESTNPMGTAPRIAPRSIVQFFRAAAWVVLAASLGACSGQPSGAGAQPVTDTDGGVTDVAADGGLPDSVDCPGPASIGAMDLVAAWQAHQPTTAELNETAFMWALAIQTVANGGLDPETQAVVEAALADPTQANLFGAQVPGLYPALFNGCDLADDAGPSDHRHIVHTMHYPFQCSDDCRASLDQLLQYYGIYGNVLQALGQKLGADVGNILGNVISATGNGGTLKAAVDAYESTNTAYNIVTTVGGAIANSAAVSGAVAALAGAEVPAAALEALAAFINLPVAAAKTVALANLINACIAWKADPKNGCTVSTITGVASSPGWDGSTMTITFQATATAVSGYPGVAMAFSGTAKLSWAGISTMTSEQRTCSDTGTTATCTLSETAMPLAATMPIMGSVMVNSDGTLDVGLEGAGVSTPVQDTVVEQCPCTFGSWGSTDTTNTTLTPFEVIGLCAGGNGWTLTSGKYDKTWTSQSGVGQCHIQAR
jgi:hypothetical protein